MQREPVLRAARNGKADSRSEQRQPATNRCVGPMTSSTTCGAWGSPSSASCCCSPRSSARTYAALPSAAPGPRRQRPPREPEGERERGPAADPRGGLHRLGRQGGTARRHLVDPGHPPAGAGRRGHRGPGAERRRRARPGLGLARPCRHLGLPGSRRELLRPPQRAQAGRRDHLLDRVQHLEVPGERPTGRGGRLERPEHDRRHHGARHLLAPERAVLHLAAPAHPRDRGGRRGQGREPRPGQGVRRHGPVDELHDLGAAAAPGSGPLARPELRADGDHEPRQRVGELRPVARARSPSRLPPSRPTSGASMRRPSRTPGSGAPSRPAWRCPRQLDGASVSDHLSPLDVEIDSVNGAPNQVVLRETVRLSGGPDPGEYAETVVLPVHKGVVHDRELDAAAEPGARRAGWPGP